MTAKNDQDLAKRIRRSTASWRDVLRGFVSGNWEPKGLNALARLVAEHMHVKKMGSGDILLPISFKTDNDKVKADIRKICKYVCCSNEKCPELSSLAVFRRRLAAEDIAELGFGEFPGPRDQDAGHTFAIILDCGKDRWTWVEDQWEEIQWASFALSDINFSDW
jgi:hypothetical protein